MKLNWNKHQNISIFIILFLTFLVYFQTLKFDFVWDDQSFINWLSTKSFQNIPKLLRDDLPAEHIGVFRPLRSLLQFFLFQIFHTNPFYYHLFALIIHLVTTYLVFVLIKKITSLSRLKETEKLKISLLSSLLFGLHPIHIEAITWISASLDSLVTIPILLSLIHYSNFSKTKSKKYYFFSILFSIIAVYFNEFALTIPLLIIFYDIEDMYKKHVGDPGQSEGFQQSNKKNFIKKISLYIPYIINNLIYLFIRFQILGIKGRFTYPFGKLIYSILFIPNLLIHYLSLLFLPLNLTPNHNLSSNLNAFFYVDKDPNLKLIPPQITDPNIFIPILLIFLIIFLALKFKKKNPLISFSIFAFFICLSPILNLIPQSSLFSEKYLYLPSVFFCIFLSSIFISFFKNSKFSLIFYFILTTYYFLLTTSYNKNWQNNITLWEHATKTNPTSSSSFTNLGNGYFEKDIFDKAKRSYQKAITLNPYQSPAWTNLGIIYLQKNDYQNAELNLQNAVKYTPGYYKAHNYLGIVYHQQEKLDKALEYYQSAYTLFPNYPDPYYYSALIYHQENDWEKAEVFYQKAISLNPNYIDTYYNLANLYLDLGENQKAKNNFQKVLDFDPNHTKSQQALEKLNN